MADLSFFLGWLANPLRVGAVSPSNPALADAITAEITPACAPVIELGPGTDVFTRALIARGIPESQLALIEYNIYFARKLKRRSPKPRVVWMDATRLKYVDPFNRERAGAVVSGLPPLLMPPKNAMAVDDGAYERLRPEGASYRFGYGPDSSVSRAILDRLGLNVARFGGMLANVPPAIVYPIRRHPTGSTEMGSADVRATAMAVEPSRYGAVSRMTVGMRSEMRASALCPKPISTVSKASRMSR